MNFGSSITTDQNFVMASMHNSKKAASAYSNRALTLLYWDLGDYILEVYPQLSAQNFYYNTIPPIAAHLTREFGTSFNKRNLYRMIKFRRTFYVRSIVDKLSNGISWSQFTLLSTVPTVVLRHYYVDKLLEEMWSVRKLRSVLKSAALDKHSFAISQIVRINYSVADYPPAELNLTLNDLYLLSYIKEIIIDSIICERSCYNRRKRRLTDSKKLESVVKLEFKYYNECNRDYNIFF